MRCHEMCRFDCVFSGLCSLNESVRFVVDMANRLVPVLFYANKMDLPQAVSTAELTELLELERILGKRAFHIAYVG